MALVGSLRGERCNYSVRINTDSSVHTGERGSEREEREEDEEGREKMGRRKAWQKERGRKRERGEDKGGKGRGNVEERRGAGREE